MDGITICAALLSLWQGGVKPGISYGETDDYCYNITQDPLHVHDLHATMLNILGIDHERLTYKFQGRRFRLTDLHGRLVRGIMALLHSSRGVGSDFGYRLILRFRHTGDSLRI